jgi:RNA polymerase sigma-70 factor, ECF subfamily
MYRADVTRLAHRLLGGRTDLDDVVQEVFLEVYKSLEAFPPNARFSTWLWRMTVQVVSMRRAALSGAASADAHETAAPQGESLPDESAARGRVQALFRLLNRLSDKHRVAFVLHELEGHSPGEIAKIVGAPLLAVHTRIFYARRELAALMAEEPALARLASDLAPSDIHVQDAARLASENEATARVPSEVRQYTR